MPHESTPATPIRHGRLRIPGSASRCRVKFHVPLLSLALVSCTYLPRPTPAPVRTEVHDPAGRADELVVLLPGRHSLPGEFEAEGFVERIRASRPSARLVVPDLHIGYYRDRSAAGRLHQDIIEPAKAAGIGRITLVGISMGGLGAMLYEIEHPGQVDEIILLSPFLGDASVIADIGRQGGLDAWRPTGRAPDGFSRRLWSALRDDWRERPDRAALRLGCGESDRLASTTRLAARELAPRQTLWIPGDHDWPTWNALIETLEAQRSSTSAHTSRR